MTSSYLFINTGVSGILGGENLCCGAHAVGFRTQ